MDSRTNIIALVDELKELPLGIVGETGAEDWQRVALELAERLERATEALQHYANPFRFALDTRNTMAQKGDLPYKVAERALREIR